MKKKNPFRAVGWQVSNDLSCAAAQSKTIGVTIHARVDESGNEYIKVFAGRGQEDSAADLIATVLRRGKELVVIIPTSERVL